ncbi:hypothetical protein [Guptibacillus sedimenti]|uniref:hypothetical protein n=1 Tax=Guptibacillus sedimenti TaxID=3025680 RepID=UPI002361AA73|nr:hypothetical protein [Pseudalkalibacillus sedimenti]
MTFTILFIGSFYQIFTVSEMVLFSLLLVFIMMVIVDIRRSSFKEKDAKWPRKYILMSGAFTLVSFLS